MRFSTLFRTQGQQCPEDAHSCLGHWDVENFTTMLDGLQVINKGVEIDASPQKSLSTMGSRMEPLELGAGVEESERGKEIVHRIG